MDKKICPDCGREYALEDETCVDCGSKLKIMEVFEPEEWLIAYHEPIRENVENVAADLAAHGVEGKVRYVDLSDFNVSIKSSSMWALLVSRENAAAAVETLHKLYGYTEEAEREDVEALGNTYEFLGAPVEELATQKALWPLLCGAIRDEGLPAGLAEKARDALTAAGHAAEDDVLAALVAEIRENHYALRPRAFEPLIEILGEIATPKTPAQLLALCTHDDSTVRINAIHCVAWLGSADHAEALLPLLEDEDTDVRQETNATLQDLVGESAWVEHILSIEDGSKAKKAWEKVLAANP